VEALNGVRRPRDAAPWLSARLQLLQSGTSRWHLVPGRTKEDLAPMPTARWQRSSSPHITPALMGKTGPCGATRSNAATRSRRSQAVFSLSSSLRWNCQPDAQLNLRADGYEAELRR